jgi:hypothetical protein
MNAWDSQIGQYKVTVRLFYLISELPQDKQYILYQQLLKGSVLTKNSSVCTLKAINEMFFFACPFEPAGLF